MAAGESNGLHQSVGNCRQPVQGLKRRVRIVAEPQNYAFTCVLDSLQPQALNLLIEGGCSRVIGIMAGV